MPTFVRHIVLLTIGLVVLAGCPVSPYGGNAGGRLPISRDAVYTYLQQSQLASPEVVQKVSDCLRRGDRFRERVLDQRSRWTLLTVWIDLGRENVLNVVTMRDDSCPVCGGTGSRTWKGNQIMERMPFDTRCLKCSGRGKIENHVTERKYTLSAADFEDRAVGQQVIQEVVYRNAPPEAQRYIDQVASDDPAVRMRALEWLDRNYVKADMLFQDALPLLRKARWHEKDDERRVMLWQFHAAKGATGGYDKAYYRIYADSHTGRITYKGFYPEK